MHRQSGSLPLSLGCGPLHRVIISRLLRGVTIAASRAFVPINTQNRLPAYPPEICFCSLAASPPTPFFADCHLRLCTVPALFFPRPSEIFGKKGNHRLPPKRRGRRSKINRRAAVSVKRCSKGLGCFPTSKTCGSRRCRKPQFRVFVGTNALLAAMVTPLKRREMIILYSGPHPSDNGRDLD